jgi:DNA ligase (NAD+)
MSSKGAEIDHLEASIRHHNQRYFGDNAPEISDDDFDRLVERLKVLRPDSPVLAEVGAGEGLAVAPELKWEHRVPMLSLEKCYDEETLKKWAEKWEGEAIESPKVDGVAAAYIYDGEGRLSVAATRGDGRVGEVGTEQLATVRGVPRKVDIPGLEVRGEVHMPLSVFERFSDRFANPRNTAAGGIKQKDPERTRSYDLRFLAYDVLGTGLATEREKLELLDRLGFTPAEWRVVRKEEMQAGYEAWEKRREDLDYEIDGVVFRIDDVAQQQAMGKTAHHPRYAIAYKLQTESRVAQLADVEWSVSRTGAVTPVAIIEPTNLSGVTVTRISLHNLGMVRKLGLTEGCTLRVTRRGGVIPYVEGVESSRGEPVQPPTECPSCGEALIEDGDTLSCANPDCERRRLGILEHYVKVVGADGFGPAILEQAFNRGLLSDVDGFYALTAEDLMPLERMGEILAAKLVSQIQDRRSQRLSTFLVSLGIPEVGPTLAEVLERELRSFEALRAATAEDLAEIHGIGEVTAGHIVSELGCQADRIARLLSHVTLLPPPAELFEEPSGPLAGLSFVFTGKLTSGDRKGAGAKAKALGGSAPSAVTKDLDFLVVGDEGSPLFGGGRKGSKIVKAEKLAAAGAPVRVISETEFLRMVEGAPKD